MRLKSLRGVFALALVLGVGSASWLTISAGAAGNAGSVKLHDIGDPTADTADNPKPCDPVLVSFDFAIGSSYTYEFRTHPGGTLVSSDTVLVTADPQQEDPAGTFNDGDMYKLQWDFGGEITGGSKQKVFKIDCAAPDPQVPDPGSFEVTKTVSGPGAPADWAFDVSIVCSDGSASDVTLSDEEPSATLTNLDAGTTCTVTEPDNQGATTTFSPSATSDPVPENGTATVTIDNAFAEVGGIDVTEPTPAVAVSGVPSFTG